MQFFVSLLLAGLVLSLCTGEISTQCINHGYIKESPGNLSRCDQLYTIVEEALISNSENLYALRRTFYPQTGLPAPLLCVNYNITSDDELLTNGSTNIQLTIKRSTSSLFSVINPYVLLEFVSGYILVFVERGIEAEDLVISLDVTTSMTASVLATEQEMIETLEILTTRLEAYAKEQGKLTDWDGSGRGYTWEYQYLSQWFWLFLVGDIFLSIFAISLAPQFYLTLKRAIANKVQQYQTSKSTPAAAAAGVTVRAAGMAPAGAAGPAPGPAPMGAAGLAPVGVAGSAPVGAAGSAPELVEVAHTAPETGAETSHSPPETFEGDKIFYIVALVLAVICVLEFACSIYVTVRAAAICPTQSCLEEVIPTRVIILFFIVVIGIIGSLIFTSVSDRSPQQKSVMKKITDKKQQSSEQNRSPQQESLINKITDKHHIVYFFISAREFLTIAGFIAVFIILAVNIIPTIILGFIFPFEVITGVVYLPMIGIVVLLYTEVASYIISEWKNNIIYVKEKRREDDKKALLILYWVFNIFIIILFVSAATVIFVFSFTVHKAEVHPSFVSTIIPPIILFLLTTLAKKYVIDKYDPPQTVNINKCAEALPVHNADAPV